MDSRVPTYGTLPKYHVLHPAEANKISSITSSPIRKGMNKDLILEDFYMPPLGAPQARGPWYGRRLPRLPRLPELCLVYWSYLQINRKKNVSRLILNYPTVVLDLLPCFCPGSSWRGAEVNCPRPMSIVR